MRCEALEERQLLSATPTRQFDLVTPIVYETDSKIPDTIVCMASAKISSTTQDDLIVVNQATNSIQILQYNATDEVFDRVYKEIALTDIIKPDDMSFAFTDVNGDGYQDFVMAKLQSSATKFDLYVYKGGAGGTFVRQSPYSGYSVP
ncbi:MAG: hypothetical protein Q4G59_04700, partial [Planctomycetia bacterium]|nr:hypothetical protein [Planctomycetia bacterium]